MRGLFSLYIFFGIAALFTNTIFHFEYLDWLLYVGLLVLASKNLDGKHLSILAFIYIALLYIENFIFHPGHIDNLFIDILAVIVLLLLTFHLNKISRIAEQEAKLREQLSVEHENLAEVYNRIHEWVFALDNNFNITYKNLAADREGYSFLNIGDNFFDKMPKIKGTSLEYNIHKAVETQKPVNFRYTTQYSRISRTVSVWVYPSINGVTLFGNDISDLVKAKNEIRSARETLKIVTDRIHDGLAGLDNEGRFTYVNLKILEWLSLNESDLLGKLFWDALPMYKDSIIEEKFRQILHTRKETKFEFKGIYLDNRYLNMTVTPSDTGMTVLIQDVTDYKDAQIKLQEMITERDYLLKEMNHRVKNNLGIVSNIISLESFNNEDPKTKWVLDDISNRIKSISLLHSKLYEKNLLNSIDISEYIMDIIHNLASGYSLSPDNFETTLFPVTLDIQTAMNIGIVVNELVTNSFKYACCDKAKLMVCITLIKNQDQLKLIIRDNGCGYAEQNPRSNSLGLELVRHIVSRHDGTLLIENRSGAYHEINIPV